MRRQDLYACIWGKLEQKAGAGEWNCGRPDRESPTRREPVTQGFFATTVGKGARASPGVGYSTGQSWQASCPLLRSLGDCYTQMEMSF
ncbi:hypothetical protein BRADI_2g23855v3 [Brachypodium distachyon]|uniref:Uncharacterized protein n=1 Tax=Brachypodium distachyon TaxID=15368 RepID=A0A2K2DA42_BRADI|nr:hypothetical protein BRADI_2g23855v3 [Brachypodium distachyon]